MDSCDEEDNYVIGQIGPLENKLVRGDEHLGNVGGEEMIDVFESEVGLVVDSFADNTKVRGD